jgi:outer membrane protein assembly factor BamB
VCLDADTGDVVWRRDLEVVAGFAVGRELLYAATVQGTLVALSRSDGQQVWEAKVDDGLFTGPVLAGDIVVAGASRGGLLAFAADTGKEVNAYDPGPGIHAQPLVFKSGVAFLSDGGALHWVGRWR